MKGGNKGNERASRIGGWGRGKREEGGQREIFREAMRDGGGKFYLQF